MLRDLHMLTNEEELVEKAKRGDKSAFAEIYSFFLPRVYRFVYYMVDEVSLAEDITQDAFIKAWSFLPKFSARKGTFQAFIYRVARNLVIDHQRKKREVSLESEVVQNIEGSENLEENFGKNEEIEKIKNALSGLAEFEREILILRYFEDFSFEEIAKVTKKREGAVRVRVHRAIAKLKERIEK